MAREWLALKLLDGMIQYHERLVLSTESIPCPLQYQWHHIIASHTYTSCIMHVRVNSASARAQAVAHYEHLEEDATPIEPASGNRNKRSASGKAVAKPKKKVDVATRRFKEIAKTLPHLRFIGANVGDLSAKFVEWKARLLVPPSMITFFI